MSRNDRKVYIWYVPRTGFIRSKGKSKQLFILSREFTIVQEWQLEILPKTMNYFNNKKTSQYYNKFFQQNIRVEKRIICNLCFSKYLWFFPGPECRSDKYGKYGNSCLRRRRARSKSSKVSKQLHICSFCSNLLFNSMQNSRCKENLWNVTNYALYWNKLAFSLTRWVCGVTSLAHLSLCVGFDS